MHFAIQQGGHWVVYRSCVVFFVQTVDYALDYASECTVCLRHNYNDASDVCPEQGNRNQIECSMIITKFKDVIGVSVNVG